MKIKKTKKKIVITKPKKKAEVKKVQRKPKKKTDASLIKDVCGKCRKEKKLCKCGRPPKYHPTKTIKLVQKFLDEECGINEERSVKSQSENSTGGSSSWALSYVPQLPTKTRLAEYLGIHIDTIYEWEKKHEEFSETVKRVAAKYEEMLLVGGLSRKLDSRIVNLLLSSKFGYAEKKKIDITAASIFDND